MIAELSVGAQMGILLLLGFLSIRLKVVSKSFPGELSKFLINFCIPCVILKVLLSDKDGAGTNELLSSTAVASAVSLIGFLVALIMTKLTGKKDDFSRVTLAALMFSNFTFMGFPVVEALYGGTGLVYISLISIPIRFLLYFGLPVIFSTGEKHAKGTWKRLMLSPPIVAVFAGLILSSLGISLPAPVQSVVNGLSTASTSLGMMLCGMLVAGLSPRELFSDWRIVITTLSRLVIVPLVSLAVLFFLPIGTTLRNVGVIFAALPTASILSAYAAKSGVRPCETAAVIALSTIVSLVTLPVWAWVLTLI